MLRLEVELAPGGVPALAGTDMLEQAVSQMHDGSTITKAEHWRTIFLTNFSGARLNCRQGIATPLEGIVQENARQESPLRRTLSGDREGY
jgi:hypothetical protein